MIGNQNGSSGASSCGSKRGDLMLSWKPRLLRQKIVQPFIKACCMVPVSLLKLTLNMLLCVRLTLPHGLASFCTICLDDVSSAHH